jgi:hypothetical protein
VRVNALQAIYRYWLALLVAAIVVQIGSAGYGAFYAADKSDPGPMTKHQFDHGFSFHTFFGYIIFIGGVILFVLALLARLGRRRVLFSLAFALVVVLQIVLAVAGEGAPAAGVLHPINAFVVLGLIGSITVRSWALWRARPAA